MGILNIRKASRDGARLLLQLYGGSQSGKTESALIVARGLVGPTGKIVVVDTEAGRARLYADKIPGGFEVGDLTPPFSPERYRLALQEVIQYGADAIVIDSFSHAWEGEGGVLDMADKGNQTNGMAKWIKPKGEYRRLINTLLYTPAHVILCSRGKFPLIDDPRNSSKKIEGHVVPVQDKSLRYEMTIVLPMLKNGVFSTDRDYAKWPSALDHLFASGRPVTYETGQKIAEWLGGVRQVDHDLQRLMHEADEAALRGVEAYRAFWGRLAKDQQQALLPGHDDRKSRAVAADREAALADDGISGGDHDDVPETASTEGSKP